MAVVILPNLPLVPPTGKTRKKKVRRMVANGGAYWSDRLAGLALAFSRVFFFFFLCHIRSPHLGFAVGGDLAKTGVAFFRRPSRGFFSIGAWRPRAPVGEWLSVGRLFVWRRCLGVSKGDRGDNPGFSR
jgi:hypothetical protein